SVGPITDNLARLVMGEKITPRPKRDAIQISTAKFDELVGEYELQPGFVIKVFRDGEKIMTQATKQGPIEIFAMSESRFFPKVVDAELEFERGPDGKAVALILHQGGRDMRGPKK